MAEFDRSQFGLPDPRKLVADYLRLRDEGVDISREDVIRQHQRLIADLQVEFQKVDSLHAALQQSPPSSVDTVQNVSKVYGSQATVVRCPHCKHPNNVASDAMLSSLNIYKCESCDGEFQLLRERTWPDQIDQFELIERIGSGGFGTVWKARDTELNRHVALKLPRHRYLDSSEADQFLKEAQTSANLVHPNIVTVYEIGSFEDNIYIARRID